MSNNNHQIHKWLYPLAWLYEIGVNLRNKFFDWGWLPSKSYDIPIICIGNLAVGGTGKTPHTEYLIKLLQNEKLHVATLSRGYKRKSKGYLLAGKDDKALRIGDEPYQIKSKFPQAQVAVDEDRCHGIEQLLQLNQPVIDVVLLDDAFQHRYVKAGLNILLTDYNRLLCDDALLPAGRLREPISSKNRAQIVIVTKCPDDIKPIDFNIISKRLNLYAYQQLYFSKFRYGKLTPLFVDCKRNSQPFTDTNATHEILLITGIASPTPLVNELKRHTEHVHLMSFGDHHLFTAKDLHEIEEQFDKLTSPQRFIVTTEKDATRLKHHPALTDKLKSVIYVLPIEIEILQNQQDIFNQNIIGYVKTNSRNCSLSKGKDAHLS